MNELTMYIPNKSDSFSSIKGKGYTQKGKKYVSFTINENGERVSVWISENGGVENVICIFKRLIDLNYDKMPIAKYFNITPKTCESFINKKLCTEYKEKEKAIFLKNKKLRKSLKIKGRFSPLKGKTYEEIYGTKTPNCGFKKGDLNPNFTRDKYVGCTLINSKGKRFRSSYEVRFSELLESNNIPYDYEHQFKLCNGKVKIVDFIINDQLIEITGYAYEKWKQDFDIKINLLHQSYPDKKIVIISTIDKIKELKEKHEKYSTILNLDDEKEILNYIL